MGGRSYNFLFRFINNISPVSSTGCIRRMGKSKKPNQVDKSVTSTEKQLSPATSIAGGDIKLSILAKPGAKVNCITGVEPDGVSVQIAARPVEGEANAELVKFIGNVLGLKKNEISLDRGSKSRQKTLVISSPSVTAETVIAKLKEVINQ